MQISLQELEEAINYWRSVRPSLGAESALSPEVDSLATVYAMMIFHRQETAVIDTLNHTCRQLIEHWRETLPA